MPDPAVHITNGIPDAGTGIITTLGMTLLDGANAVLGATTDLTTAAGAAGTINSHLRTISRDIAGGVVLQSGGNVIGSVTQSGGPWTISGTVSVAGTVTVSGTVSATQSGTWNINNISGTVSLPTGAATAAKQPLPGIAGTPSADVITVQGTTSMTPLKVDGSGVTQPISGNVGITGNVNCVQVTSPWVTSISGNVTCVQSGNWTSRCVGNAGGIFDFSSAQNIATPAQAILIGAEYNTVPTTITSGNSSPLQLDNLANLLVNVKASVLPSGAATSANQPTAAAQGSTTSGQTGILAEGAVTTASPSYTTGQTSPLSLDPAGNLRVNVVAGGGAGGTSSSFGSAIPGTGTAAGYSDGTNMQLARVFDGDSGAGTQYSLGVLLKTPASGGAVDIGVSGQPLRVDPTGTTTQPVSGTFWQATQPVSIAAAVTVQQSTAANLLCTASQGGAWNITNITGTVTLPTGASTSALQPTNAALGSTTSGQTGNLELGAVTTSAPTYVNGQTNALSLTTAGNLRVDGSSVTQPVSGTFWQATQPVSGTVTANQGGTWTVQPGNTANTTAWLVTGTGGTFPATQSGAWNITNITGTVSLPTGASTSANQPTNAAQGSTTSGQTGNLVMGAVTTGNPTYTTGQTSPLSLDTSGAVRVNVIAGSGGGGTSSSFGSAFPATGTAIGVKDSAGTNMTFLQVNASNALKVDGSAVTQPVSGTFWQATQPISAASLPLPTGAATAANQTSIQGVIGAATAPASMSVIGGVFNTTKPTLTTGQSAALQANASGSLLVDGSAVTQPISGNVGVTGTVTVSGTVTANQGGTWTVQPGNTANTTAWLVTGTGGTFPVTGTFWQATQPVSIAAAVTVAQATAANLNALVNPLTAANWGVGSSTQNSASVANGVMALAQFNTTPTTITSGNMSPLQMDASGNLLVNIKAGGAAGGTSSSVGAATPATGTLALGAVTTAAPSYTTATANSLSLTTAGALRVDGSAVTQPVSAASLPLPTGAATSANQATAAAQGSTTSGQTGTLALAAVVSGVSAYTTAQSQPLNMDLAGNLKVNTIDPATYNAGTAWTSATGVNTAANLINSTSITYDTFAGQITQTTTITAGVITFEESFDNGATYALIPPTRFIDPTTGQQVPNPYTCVASTNQRFQIIPAGTCQMRARLSTVITGTGSVTVGWTVCPITAVEWTSSMCSGDVPAGNTDSGFPQKIGGVAKTTNPTAVTDGQRVNAVFDKQGKQVVVGAIRQLKGVQKTSITVNTETTVVTAGGAGVFNDVYAIVVTNKSATGVFVDFKDATAGTTRLTLAAPASDTRGFTVPVDSAIPQSSAAANWTATVSSAVTSIEITVLYVSNL